METINKDLYELEDKRYKITADRFKGFTIGESKIITYYIKIKEKKINTCDYFFSSNDEIGRI